MPSSSPLCVASTTNRTATVSPSATMSCSCAFRSGRAPMKPRKSATRLSLPSIDPSVPPCHLTSGVTNSAANSGLCSLNTHRVYSRTSSIFDPTAAGLAIICLLSPYPLTTGALVGGSLRPPGIIRIPEVPSLGTRRRLSRRATGDGRWQVTVGEPTSEVSKTHGTPQSLRGRREELARLYRMVDDLSHHGGAIVVRGEAGICKSALLAAHSRHAPDRGAMVLSASGVESEAQFPFAGLHQLLRPSLSLLPRLPEPQRHALEMAFGLGSHRGVSDVFLIGLATLGLVSELATETPVLLVVDDAHWLDRSSAKALAFVARRLEMEPAVLLLAVRDEVSSDIDEAGLAELRGGRLDSDASRALLDVTGAVLSEDLKDRILEAAAGNPLALTELPIAAS